MNTGAQAGNPALPRWHRPKVRAAAGSKESARTRRDVPRTESRGMRAAPRPPSTIASAASSSRTENLLRGLTPWRRKSEENSSSTPSESSM